MRRNIFEVLGNNFTQSVELGKLLNLLETKPIATITHDYRADEPVNFETTFNMLIEDYPDRGTCTSYDEVISVLKAESSNEISSGNSGLMYSLFLCELILNYEVFLKRMSQKYRDIKIQSASLVFQNAKLMVDKLNYRNVEADGRIILVPKDADAVETAAIVSDTNISDAILEYLDFRIANDKNEKGILLFKLGKYIEPKRSELDKKYPTISDAIFIALNKFDVRHPYNPKDKIEAYVMSNKTDKELIELYDDLYYLILLGIRLLESEEIIDKVNKIKKEANNQK